MGAGVTDSEETPWVERGDSGGMIGSWATKTETRTGPRIERCTTPPSQPSGRRAIVAKMRT